MYSVSVSRSFRATHFLTVPNPGPEGTAHAHDYTVDVRVGSKELNEYQYVVDIDRLEEGVEAIVDTYGNNLLNELPEFAGVNPSLEYFCRVIADQVQESLHATNDHLEFIEITMWEDDVANATYRMKLAAEAD